MHDIETRWAKKPVSLVENLLKNRTDGRIKLFLMLRGLAARNYFRNVFRSGGYHPLKVTGEKADHVIAFARHKGEHTVITVVPRFLTGLVEPGTAPIGKKVWGDTRVEVPAGGEANWTNWVANEPTDIVKDNPLVGDLLSQFPVALIVSENHSLSAD